jgi:MSHA biogenesis protein MshE
MEMAKPLPGEMLIEDKIITQEQLNGALEICKQQGGLVGIQLVSQGFITEQQLVEYLAKQAKAVDANSR